MTTFTVCPTPVRAAVPASAGAKPADPANASEFQGLVDQHLAALPADTAVAAEAAPVVTAGEGEVADEATADDLAETAEDPTTNLTATGAPLALVAVPVKLTGTTPGLATGPATPDPAAGQSQSVTPEAPGQPAAATPDGTQPTIIPDVTGADAPAPVATAATGDPEVAAPAVAATPAQTPATVVASPTVVAAAGITPTEATTALARPAQTEVANQVFTTIPRLVGKGDGVHTMTMLLHPRDLGEVQITVTVRNGTADVRLAAGAEAQHALRNGASELRHMLELTGVSAGNLVIRDLPSTVPSLGSASGAMDGPASGRDGFATGADSDREARREGDQHGDRRTTAVPAPPPEPSIPRRGSSTALDLRL